MQGISDNLLSSKSFQTLVFGIWAVLGLGLMGCVANPVAITSEVLAVEKASTPEVKEHKRFAVRSFPEGTLLALLSAEIAGYRGDYQSALETYLAEARKTGDPGVAARVTRLAAYMKAEQALFEAAEIWTAADPTSLEAHQFLADQLVKRGAFYEAFQVMQAIEALNGKPQYDFFAYRVGSISKAERAQILGGLKQMLLEDPDAVEVLFSIGAILQSLDQLDEASGIADRLLVLAPEELNFVILKANLLTALKQPEDAIALLRAQLNSNPDRHSLRMLLARGLFERRNLAEARQEYERLHQVLPEDGEVLFALAVLSIEDGQYEQARRHLLRLVRTEQRVNQAQYYLGRVAEKTEDTALALREYNKVAGGYEFISAQGRVADLMQESQGLEAARQHLAQQRQRLPSLAAQFELLEGQMLSRLGLKDSLFAHLDDAIGAHPEDIPLLYFRAMSGQRFGDLVILERDLKEVIRLDPDNADAMNALGYTLADQTDRFDEALDLISQALAIKPDEPAFIDSMGWVLYRLNRLEEALPYLERALALFPNDEVAAHLGEVLWASGQKRQAKKIWREALKDYPDSVYIRSVLERFLDS
jgi:tetratricopeptide (TPR) repeat protein